MKYYLIIVLAVILFSCAEKEKSWQLSESILIEGVNPIGITTINNEIWLSDGDHNRVVKIDESGQILETIDSLDRPMHISSYQSSLLIPQYGNDMVMSWEADKNFNLSLSDSLDAPAGVSQYNDEIAIADFYNNRILYTEDGKQWKTFGKEGKLESEFYYPTDVQITSDKIYVADAYNNRIQVFDKAFKFLKAIGEDQDINAATGIFVTDSNVFTTDFENDRVLVFNFEGELLHELNNAIEKPTDLLVNNNKLYVINYRNSLMNIFELKDKPVN